MRWTKTVRFSAWWLVAVGLAVLIRLPTGPRLEAQEGLTGARLQEVLARFDAYAEASRQRWGVPGMAIAVVQGDRVVFSKGYGVRVQGEPARVEPATVFKIGSISKSFTATVSTICG